MKKMRAAFTQPPAKTPALFAEGQLLIHRSKR